MNNKVSLLIALSIGLLIGFLLGKNASPTFAPSQGNTSFSKEKNNQKIDYNSENEEANTGSIPSKAITVWKYIQENDKAPDNYVGGRNFRNFEGQLPKTENGEKINYREWDVNMQIKGKNRGKERLVSGSNGRCYYTDDHYKTFTEIKNQ